VFVCVFFCVGFHITMTPFRGSDRCLLPLSPHPLTQVLQLLESSPASGLGLPSSMWQRHRPRGSGDGAAAGAEAAAPDVRIARLASLGLGVEMPQGVEGRVGLRPLTPAAGSADESYWCESLHEACMLAHWAAAERQAEGWCGSPGAQQRLWAVGRLQQAKTTLAAHLELCGKELERLLPVWRQTGFLM
jgi:hypothetical protein